MVAYCFCFKSNVNDGFAMRMMLSILQNSYEILSLLISDFCNASEIKCLFCQAAFNLCVR